MTKIEARNADGSAWTEKSAGDLPASVRVYGKATGSEVDSDGEIIDKGFARDGMEKWFSTGANIRQMHSPLLPPAGVGVELHKGEDGVYVVGDIYEPGAVRQVLKGGYSAYSVGLARVKKVIDPKAPKGRITGGEFVELSLVDRPANATCKIQVMKREGVTTDGAPEGDLVYVGGLEQQRAEEPGDAGPSPRELLAAGDPQSAFMAGIADVRRSEVPDVVKAGGSHPFTGTHTHAHPAYGEQGGDATHEHSHTHNDDGIHDPGDAAGAHSHEGQAPSDGGDAAASDKAVSAERLKIYSADDVSGLPENVQKLSADERKRWVGAFNSRYTACKADGKSDSDCDAEAFRLANGLVKKTDVPERTKALDAGMGMLLQGLYNQLVAECREDGGSGREAEDIGQIGAAYTRFAEFCEDEAEEPAAEEAAAFTGFAALPNAVKTLHDVCCGFVSDRELAERWPTIRKDGVATALGPSTFAMIYQMLLNCLNQDGGTGICADEIGHLTAAYHKIGEVVNGSDDDDPGAMSVVLTGARATLAKFDRDMLQYRSPLDDPSMEAPITRGSAPLDPTAFRRTFQTNGRARENGDAGGGGARIPTADPLKPDDFTRQYLTEGRAVESPGTTKADGGPGPTGRRYYSGGDRAHVLASLKTIHDHLAALHPEVCPAMATKGDRAVWEAGFPAGAPTDWAALLPAVAERNPALPRTNPLDAPVSGAFSRDHDPRPVGASLPDAGGFAAKSAVAAEPGGLIQGQVLIAQDPAWATELTKQFTTYAEETKATIASLTKRVEEQAATIDELARQPDPSRTPHRGGGVLAVPDVTKGAAAAEAQKRERTTLYEEWRYKRGHLMSGGADPTGEIAQRVMDLQETLFGG